MHSLPHTATVNNIVHPSLCCYPLMPLLGRQNSFSQALAVRREFGNQLFMDGAKLEKSEWGGVEALFGSFTDPSFVSPSPPVGPLGRLAGRVSIAWAGAVLHVLSKEDVRTFARHAHLMLAPGGAWIGVRARPFQGHSLCNDQCDMLDQRELRHAKAVLLHH